MTSFVKDRLNYAVLILILGWFLSILMLGEHFFYGPFVAWSFALGLTIIWCLTGFPRPALDPATVRLWILFICYAIVHTFVIAGSPFAWKYAALHGFLFIWCGLLFVALVPLMKRPIIPESLFLLSTLALAAFPLLVWWMGHYPFSTRVNWGAMILILGIMVYFFGKTNRRIERFILFMTWFLLLANLILSRSRASLLFLVFMSCVAGWRILRERGFLIRYLVILLILLVGVGSILAYWTYRQGMLGTARLAIWVSDLKMLRNFPLGVGLGQVPLWLPRYSPQKPVADVRYALTLEHPHQQILGWMLEWGVPIVLFIYLLIRDILTRIHAIPHHNLRNFFHAVLGLFGVWCLVHDVFAYQFLTGIFLLFYASLQAWSLSPKAWRIPGWVMIAGTLFFILGSPAFLSIMLTGCSGDIVQQHPERARVLSQRAINLWKGNAWAYARYADAINRVSRRTRRETLDVLYNRYFAVLYHPGERRFLSALAGEWSSVCHTRPAPMTCAQAEYWLRSYLKWKPQDVLARWSLFNLNTGENRRVQLKIILEYEPNFLTARYAYDHGMCGDGREKCSVDIQPYREARSRWLTLSPEAGAYIREVLRIPPPSTLIDP